MTTTQATQASRAKPGVAADDRLDRSLVALGTVVVLGTILSILDATIVNVATRTLGEDFHAPISTIQWVLTGYLLGFTAVIPVTGCARQRFGAQPGWIAWRCGCTGCRWPASRASTPPVPGCSCSAGWRWSPCTSCTPSAGVAGR